MDGSSSDRFQIPAGYKYMSVINNTDNTLYIYQERRSDNVPQDALIKVPTYTQQTLPISTERFDITIFYTDGGGAGTKKAEVIFSVENLGIQGTLGTAISGTITLGADGVGLARQTQLPGELGGAGGLKVELLNGGTVVVSGAIEVTNDEGNPLPVSGSVDIVTIPSLPAGTNNIGDVDVLSLPPIPAGTNNIGDVDVLTLPDMNIAAKTAIKVTAGASGDQTVRGDSSRYN
jgi:hypothetical protein